MNEPAPAVVIEIVGLDAQQERELLAWADEQIALGAADWAETFPAGDAAHTRIGIRRNLTRREVRP